MWRRFFTYLDIASASGRWCRRRGRTRRGRIGDGRHLVLEETLPISLILGEDLVLGGIGGLVLALIHGHQPPHGADLPGLVFIFLSSSICADDECGEANDAGDAEPHAGDISLGLSTNDAIAMGSDRQRWVRPSLAFTVPNAEFKAVIMGCPMERLHVLCQGAAISLCLFGE